MNRKRFRGYIGGTILLIGALAQSSILEIAFRYFIIADGMHSTGFLAISFLVYMIMVTAGVQIIIDQLEYNRKHYSLDQQW